MSTANMTSESEVNLIFDHNVDLWLFKKKMPAVISVTDNFCENL